jgi:hypothetical protein
MDDKVMEQGKMSRRDFLRFSAAGLGALAGAEINRRLGRSSRGGTGSFGASNAAGSQVESAANDESLKPNFVEAEDILDPGWRMHGVSQGERGDPPYDVEYGPGFFTKSYLVGENVPKPEQEGSHFWWAGARREDVFPGGTVTAQGGGVTVVEGASGWRGAGANIMCGMGLGVGRDYQQALVIMWDNATSVQKNNGFSQMPSRVIIPLSGLRPELPENVDDRNVVWGVEDNYRSVDRVAIKLRDGDKELTFEFKKDLSGNESNDSGL